MISSFIVLRNQMPESMSVVPAIKPAIMWIVPLLKWPVSAFLSQDISDINCLEISYFCGFQTKQI